MAAGLLDLDLFYQANLDSVPLLDFQVVGCLEADYPGNLERGKAHLYLYHPKWILPYYRHLNYVNLTGHSRKELLGPEVASHSADPEENLLEQFGVDLFVSSLRYYSTTVLDFDEID